MRYLADRMTSKWGYTSLTDMRYKLHRRHPAPQIQSSPGVLCRVAIVGQLQPNLQWAVYQRMHGHLFIILCQLALKLLLNM